MNDDDDGPNGVRRRGRIPHQDWPRIVERYRTGSTLAEIARDYGCTPSAIAYVVKKAEATGALDPGDAAELPLGIDPAQVASAPIAPLASAQPASAPPAAGHLASPPSAPAVQAPGPADVPEDYEPDPIDETEARFRHRAAELVDAYRAWIAPDDPESRRAALSDAVHELRKVVARIEIAMASGQRDDMSLRPIPIPMHRASRRGS